MVVQSLKLIVPVPCTVGHISDKLATYQTQVRPSEIINLLGHDPRSQFWKRLPDDLRDIYEYLQRKTSKGRRENTRRYIEERFRSDGYVLGAFPAIAIGCVQPLEFESYSEKYPNTGIAAGVGELQFDLSSTSTRILLDGMARVTGALDLLDDGSDLEFAFPVTIFAPTERLGRIAVQDLGQLFHDFNFLAQPVQRGHAIDLDQSNIYIQMTNAVGRAPVIVNNGGMEPRAASLGAKSTALVAKQVLLRFIRGAIEGVTFQERLRDSVPESPILSSSNFEAMRTTIERYLTTIAEAMGSDAWRDRERLHLTAPGWNALGVVFHDIHVSLADRLTDEQKADLARHIGQLDWSRWNQDFTGYLGEVAMRDKDGKEIRSRSRTNSPDPETLTPVTNDRGQSKLGILFGGRLGGTRFIEYIRDKIGLFAELRAADLELGKDEDENEDENENENTLGPDARASTTPQADTAGTLV